MTKATPGGGVGGMRLAIICFAVSGANVAVAVSLPQHLQMLGALSWGVAVAGLVVGLAMVIDSARC